MNMPPLPPFQYIAAAGLLATVGAIGFHYVVFGAHRLGGPKMKTDFRRFSIWERLIHAAVLVSFVTLGVTGMTAAIGYGSRITGWLWIIHAFAAPVFLVALTGVVAMWARDGRFAAYDFKWMLFVGGYLGIGKNKGLKAGRFNAGQKAYLWIVAVLGVAVILSGIGRMFPILTQVEQGWLYQIHRYATLLASMAVIGHAYLGTLANPGTIQVTVTGRVTEEWAKHHHPVWWEEVNKGQAK